MIAVFAKSITRLLSLSWLTGPIFGKELRVSSRRRRNFVLRFVYLALLTFLLTLFWIETVPANGSGLHQASMMAEAGQMIIVFIVWFQFWATQVVAAIMLSSAISEEIYNRTLGLLMTTPISSLQIVMGKLFSRLLQLVLLLAISLPLLAIVRVFGGVPWGYVVSSLGITLTTVIFVASLSLFYSVFTRRAYVVMIVTGLTLGVLFGVLPYMIGGIHSTITGKWPGQKLTEYIFYPNPYAAMIVSTIRMLDPSAWARGPSILWSAHCAIMLLGSGLVLLLSVIMVRRAALRQVAGEVGASSRVRRPDQARRIRSVTDPPVLWKELRSPIFGRRKAVAIGALVVGLVLLFVSYVLFAQKNALKNDEVHILYAMGFTCVGMLFTAIIPCACITSEKESRSWPLLLATTLGDGQILFGKLGGLLRRCLPVWGLLLGHVVAFSLAGVIHPVAIVQIGIVIASVVVFLSCTGLYFSSRFRHTTAAVIANFALAAALWLILPFVLALGVEALDMERELAEAYFDTVPFVHIGVVMDATIGASGLHDYNWAALDNMGSAQSTLWLLFCMAGYMSLAFIFAWRARCRLRRNIF
jgi:ABC-2 type transport system permease protein